MVALIIDHYDSYTQILAHYFWELTGSKPILFQHDQVLLEDLKKLEFDFVVLSPGPGRPEVNQDFSLGYDLLKVWPKVPVLGVCLGHQALAFYEGAKIIHAPKPMHGKISRLTVTSPHPLFSGLPETQEVVRYHSLVVDRETLPKSILPIAYSLDDQQLMAFQVKDHPWYGVQFHPESCGTPYGKEILKNFLKIVSQSIHPENSSARSEKKNNSHSTHVLNDTAVWEKTLAESPSGLSEFHEALEKHFETNWLSQPGAFWLDSSLQNIHHFWHVQGSSTYGISEEEGQTYEYIWHESGWLKKSLAIPLQEALNLRLKSASLASPHRETATLFSGGWVGAVGYEFSSNQKNVLTKKSIVKQPDAFFYWVENFDCIQANTGMVHTYRQFSFIHSYVLCTTSPLSKIPESHFSREIGNSTPDFCLQRSDLVEDFPGKLVSSAQSFEEYLKSIQYLQKAIREGETYEACLTNQFWKGQNSSHWDCYRQLRKKNPGFYGGFLMLPQCAILSSSPELFLSVSSDGRVQTEPIKGTRKMDGLLSTQKDLLNHIKDNSELLMITDLLRNDLSKNTEPGSIKVLAGKKITGLKTLYQMSSVIEGKLSAHSTVIDLLFACLPGGSISGAPKLRTQEILNSLEPISRGFYTGTMGYIDLSGKSQMNILIRTLVADGKNLFWGGGGAIVYDSIPELEWQEMLSKASCCYLPEG